MFALFMPRTATLLLQCKTNQMHTRYNSLSQIIFYRFQAVKVRHQEGGRIKYSHCAIMYVSHRCVMDTPELVRCTSQ